MIEHIIEEINHCLKNDLQIAALTMALTLPDTCGKVYLPQEKVGKRYIDWYNDHIAKPKGERLGDDAGHFTISGEVVYKLRCAMLHESNPTVTGTAEKITQFSLIWRSEKSCSRTPVDRCIQLDAVGGVEKQTLSIDIVSLCQDICEAVLSYYNKNKSSFSFDYRIASVPDRLADVCGFDNKIDI